MYMPLMITALATIVVTALMLILQRMAERCIDYKMDKLKMAAMELKNAETESIKIHVISEGVLVLLRLPNNLEFKGKQPHYNTWFRVMFIDNDGTFIGRLERKHFLFELYPLGSDHRLHVKEILSVYQGEQWCYGDNVTTCNCTGLCREKM